MNREQRQRQQRREGRRVTCVRCGRTPAQVGGEWNVTLTHGVVAGYLCPDDQTGAENAEAVINEATTGPAVELNPDDPGYVNALAQHAFAVTEDVWVDWLGGVIAGRSVTFDPYALADQTLARLADTIGRPSTDDFRQQLAKTFRDFADQCREA